MGRIEILSYLYVKFIIFTYVRSTLISSILKSIIITTKHKYNYINNNSVHCYYYRKYENYFTLFII